MNKNLLLLSALSCALAMPASAEEKEEANKAKTTTTENSASIEKKLSTENKTDNDAKVERLANALSRFSIGGYGEAATSTVSTSTATATQPLIRTTPATDASTCPT